MRVLLTTLNAKYIHTNLAIRLLYELNQNHDGLEWKEFTIKEPKDDVAEQCSVFNVVAFSCYIWNISQTLEVCKKIKAINPNIKILLGGPEVSYEYEKVIAKDFIDYIIVGEGETGFAEFLKNFPNVDQVPNLVRKNKEQIIANPTAPMFDLKNYSESMPYRFDKPEELLNKVLYIETSRGCPYKCEFCLASLDNKVRYLPDASIKATLLYMMQHGKVIKFLDRTFNIKRDFTLDIFKFILEHHRPENVFQFEITADILHPDIIQFIHDNVPKDLFRFEIGIQTVNQKANLEVSRKQSFEKTKSIIKQLDYKVEMHLDLIVGLPLDYWEDIKYSIEETFKLFAPEMQLGFLKFLKGTTMRNKEQHEFVYDPEPPYQIIQSKYLSKEQLADIVKLENALEIYWNSKKATHTLRYVANRYSIFDFLLGLGKYFGTIRDYHKYSLNDVFEIVTAYAEKEYPSDIVLKQLIAIDYYLHFKVKPQVLFLEEIARPERNKLIEHLKLNHHKLRFTIIEINFDFNHFVDTGIIQEGKHHFIASYNGTNKAQIVNQTALLVSI
ncbi:B12-binding domain-containing radical SAM protein [Aurantibacillus circumpalustris]|uniref:B12-binding domain-containing radical SAM protein n=1 Tax=Aurantibacillus circumpalustris TaxID=3036359 RepID=UPI00295B1EAC|nr:radical SAM protein [Aurantibacillus circumpalustris]